MLGTLRPQARLEGVACITLKGSVTQPQVGGAGTGPTSMRTSNLISGGGAWPIRGTTPRTTRVTAMNEHLEFDMSMRPWFDTTGSELEHLHDTCR